MAPQKPKSKDRPDIYSHHDFRVFLRDWLKFLKSVDRKFTLRHLARQSGVSPGYLPLVLNGSRRFSERSVEMVVPFLNLNPSEQSYFKLLVVLGDSDSHEERLQTLQKIQRFRDYQKLNPRETEVYRYMSRWFYPAIREMVGMPGFQLDPKWIQKQLRFQIPVGEVSKAIAFLIEHDFIGVKSDGTAFLPEKSVRCIDGIYRLVLGQFHRETLELAVKSIDEVPREERKIGSYTLALRANQFQNVMKILDEAISKVKDLERENNEAEIVYHIAVAGFPLTLKVGEVS